MGERLSRLTARDLGRLGVEVHLGAMVTGLDDGGVDLTQSDGMPQRIDVGHEGMGGRHPCLSTRASDLATTAGAALDRSGRVLVDRTARYAGTRRSSSWAT
jgi:NADH dehydrogenase